MKQHLAILLSIAQAKSARFALQKVYDETYVMMNEIQRSTYLLAIAELDYVLNSNEGRK